MQCSEVSQRRVILSTGQIRMNRVFNSRPLNDFLFRTTPS